MVSGRPPILYHWSPAERRDSIGRVGLEPGHWSTDRLFRPAWVCFAAGPREAWNGSAAYPRGREHAQWDLWRVRSDDVPDAEAVWLSDALTEYRLHRRVPVEQLWFCGTRESSEPA